MRAIRFAFFIALIPCISFAQEQIDSAQWAAFEKNWNYYWNYQSLVEKTFDHTIPDDSGAVMLTIWKKIAASAQYMDTTTLRLYQQLALWEPPLSGRANYRFNCIWLTHDIWINPHGGIGRRAGVISKNDLVLARQFAEERAKDTTYSDPLRQAYAMLFIAWLCDGNGDYAGLAKWGEEAYGIYNNFREKGMPYINLPSPIEYGIDNYYAKIELAKNPSGDSWFEMASSTRADHASSSLSMVKKAISMGCKKHRVDALFLAADCEDELKEYDASVAYYNKVVLATTDPEIKRKAYDLKGDSYTGRQQYQPALTSYQKAAQQNPREARPIYSKMADCYSALGNVEKAEYYKRLSYH